MPLDKVCNALSTDLLTFLDFHASFKTFTPSTHFSPWINKIIFYQLQKRDIFYQNFSKNKEFQILLIMRKKKTKIIIKILKATKLDCYLKFSNNYIVSAQIHCEQYLAKTIVCRSRGPL